MSVLAGFFLVSFFASFVFIGFIGWMLNSGHLTGPYTWLSYIQQSSIGILHAGCRALQGVESYAASTLGMLKGRRDKAGEEGVRVVGLGLEFRVELRAQVERMVGEFDDFDEAGFRGDG